MDIARESLHVPVAGVVLTAERAVPEQARGVVLFAHGSGGGPDNPQNRCVAAELQRAGLATVLAGLLASAEEQRDAWTGELNFDISVLARRLAALTDWVAADERTAGLGIGLFGASTGAAAALVAAAERPDTVEAVVSRGGRPELADEHLTRVRQPTLLIVGGEDTAVIELNRRALERLAGEAALSIVPGATHLFEEPGALEQVAGLARDWFLLHLRPVSHRAGVDAG
jgi:putative phosphoribosyl transferase